MISRTTLILLIAVIQPHLLTAQEDSSREEIHEWQDSGRQKNGLGKSLLIFLVADFPAFHFLATFDHNACSIQGSGNSLVIGGKYS